MVQRKLRKPCGCGKKGCFDIPELTTEDFKRFRKVNFSNLKKRKKEWLDLPQKTDEQWFAEFAIMQLAMKFKKENKKWPKKLDISTLQVLEDKLGGLFISVDMQ